MKHATCYLAVLMFALPLLAQAQAAQAQFSPDEPRSHQASAVMASSTTATAQTASFNTPAKKDRGQAKAEAKQQAEWREQRARRYRENNGMSFVDDTCVYSRNTFTYSCQ